MSNSMSHWKIFAWLCLAVGALLVSGWTVAPNAPSPTPTYDPLAVPVLPKNPSDFERGKYLYYFHCMPCHGDLGQGLTSDFRSVWEEHSNCWERGCHAGRPKDEGFPIPTVIPAVIGAENPLIGFRDLASLTRYLHDTHPPQRPGRLKDGEYAALAVYLWEANNRPLPIASVTQPGGAPTVTATAAPSTTATPTISLTPLQPTRTQTAAPEANPRLGLIPLIILMMVLLSGALVFLARRKRRG